MRKLILLILMLSSFFASAQTPVTISTADSSQFKRTTGTMNAELIIMNGTRNVAGGFLWNRWNGRTQFRLITPSDITGLQDSLTKKANRTFDNVASGAIAKSKADTSATGLLPKSNLFPLSDTRYVTLGTPQNIDAVKTFRRSHLLNGSSKMYMGNGDTTINGFISGLSSTSGVLYIGSRGTNRLAFTGNTSNNNIFPLIDLEYDLGRNDRRFDSLFVNNSKIFGTQLVTGAATFSDVIKFNASTSTLAAGDMGYNSTYGQYLRGKTGSTDDWALFAAGGGYLMHNPTGTNKVAFGLLSGSGDVITGADNTGSVFKIGIGSGLSLDPSTKVLSATGGSFGSVTTSGLTAGRIVIASGASDISTTTALTISGSDLNVTGALNSGSLVTEKSLVSDYVAKIRNSNTGASTSFGLLLNGGTNTSDKALAINNAANTTTLLTVDGVGNTAITGNVTAANLGTASGYTATSANTVLTVPLRDSNGDFSAGVITASLAGNASTATALQTARNIQGVSFNGTADINPINGTGFVKASGTTLSYDNSTYLTTSSAASTYAPLSSPTFTGTPSLPTGTIGVTQTAGDNSTKIATTAYVDGAILSSDYLPFTQFSGAGATSGTLSVGFGAKMVAFLVHNGTTTTFSLPPVVSTATAGSVAYIKNRGSGNITINSNAGGNDIYATSAVNTYSVTPGSSIIISFDGTYFNIL